MYATEKSLPVFRCTDGLLRDVLSSRVKIRNLRNELIEMIPSLLELVEYLGFTETVFVIDKQIPWSAEIAAELSASYKSRGAVFRASKADTLLIELAEAGFSIATSDIVVLKRVKHVVDLPSLYMEYKGVTMSGECLLDELVKKWWRNFCREIDL